jgi:peptidyl-prolyl cis-trans isomerase D
MFEFVRKHTKIMQIVLFLLILPSFVMFGLEGYSRFGDKGATVAKVAGEPITEEMWNEAHKREVDRLRARMPNVDPKLLDSPEAKYRLLERIVRDRLLALASKDLYLTVSDRRLATELQQSEAIQSIRKPDGTLDMERYKQLLATEGMTPEIFEARMRNDLSANQVLAAIAQSAPVVQQSADLAMSSFFERRTVQLTQVEPAQFLSRVSLSDAELEQYYKANTKKFETTEVANVEYLVLDMDSVRKSITVNEAELRSYYEQNAGRLGTPEERRASHILIATAPQASAADKQKAREKAAQIQSAVSKAPKTFAEVARKESQDPGSASQGGDLGFFARGAMTKAFEDAAFSLKKGDISPVVETEFGFHIIQLQDIKTGKTRNFEDMRKEVEADVLKQLAQKKFAEAAETFSNLVYEQSDSLKPAAEKFKLEVRTATGLTREGPQSAHPVLSQAKFLAAVFSADSIEKKRNTQAVEIGANTLVAGRLSQYTPARVPAYADVKDKVRDLASLDKAAELAKQDGEAKLGQLRAQPDAIKMGAEQTLSRVDRKGLSQDVVSAVLRADASKLPAFTGVDMGNKGYTLVRINKIEAGKPDSEAALKSARTQYAQHWATAETQAYYDALKAKYKVTISAPKPTSMSN